MHTLRLLTYNILRGGAGRERAIAEVINDQAPDVVVLQEATRPDVVQRLAQLTAMSTWGAHAGRSLGFMSRVPLAEHRWVRPRWSHHAFLDLVPEGIDLRIVGVHLSAVHAAWTEARRVRELRSLLAVVKQREPAPHVVLGDFNTLAPNERLDVAKLPRRLRLLVCLSGGRIRWQTIAIMLGAEYVDGFRTLHPTDAGLTFPTWDPHVRLDYVFVPQTLADRLTDCEVVRAPAAVRDASDHFPVRAEIRLSGNLSTSPAPR
jgi:endonuclease/exonuclease/phosphatase family metal-dependent hydrolase